MKVKLTIFTKEKDNEVENKINEILKGNGYETEVHNEDNLYVADIEIPTEKKGGFDYFIDILCKELESKLPEFIKFSYTYQ